MHTRKIESIILPDLKQSGLLPIGNLAVASDMVDPDILPWGLEFSFGHNSLSCSGFNHITQVAFTWLYKNGDSRTALVSVNIFIA